MLLNTAKANGMALFHKASLVSLLLSLVAFLLPVTSVNYTNGFYMTAVVLVLASWAAMPWLWRNLAFTSWEKAMLFFWLLYCVFTWFDLNFRSVWDWKEFQEPSRFLLLTPAFLLIRKYGYAEQFLRYGVLLAAIVAGIWGIYQKFYLGVHRAWGDTSGLIAAFGDISLISGVLCVALLQPKWRVSHWWKLVALIGLAMGLIASFASGTKGGWISIPLLAWVLVELTDKPTYKKRFGILGLIALLAVLLWTFSPFFQDRVSVMGPALYEYMVNGVVFDGSAGIRLALWHTSALIFFDNPLFGTGPGTYLEQLKIYVDMGAIPTAALPFSGPHSQFFNSIYESGIFGPVMVYGIYLTFIMHCKSHLQTNKSLATAGILLAIGFMDFGLVEVIWDINNAGVYFVSMMMLIAGQLSYQARNSVL